MEVLISEGSPLYVFFMPAFHRKQLWSIVDVMEWCVVLVNFYQRTGSGTSCLLGKM